MLYMMMTTMTTKSSHSATHSSREFPQVARVLARLLFPFFRQHPAHRDRNMLYIYVCIHVCMYICIYACKKETRSMKQSTHHQSLHFTQLASTHLIAIRGQDITRWESRRLAQRHNSTLLQPLQRTDGVRVHIKTLLDLVFEHVQCEFYEYGGDGCTWRGEQESRRVVGQIAQRDSK